MDACSAGLGVKVTFGMNFGRWVRIDFEALPRLLSTWNTWPEAPSPECSPSTTRERLRLKSRIVCRRTCLKSAQARASEAFISPFPIPGSPKPGWMGC
ncbi:hypothetical protein PG997_007524 [Apiospora hydei]|uniref:Uncharacterized protein n=1 Tax=Apiospora hydei TaxID=1337664 RepID=A0ABR1W8A2_9PEZI